MCTVPWELGGVGLIGGWASAGGLLYGETEQMGSACGRSWAKHRVSNTHINGGGATSSPTGVLSLAFTTVCVCIRRKALSQAPGMGGLCSDHFRRALHLLHLRLLFLFPMLAQEVQVCSYSVKSAALLSQSCDLLVVLVVGGHGLLSVFEQT